MLFPHTMHRCGKKSKDLGNAAAPLGSSGSLVSRCSCSRVARKPSRSPRRLPRAHPLPRRFGRRSRRHHQRRERSSRRVTRSRFGKPSAYFANSTPLVVRPHSTRTVRCEDSSSTGRAAASQPPRRAAPASSGNTSSPRPRSAGNCRSGARGTLAARRRGGPFEGGSARAARRRPLRRWRATCTTSFRKSET